MNNIGIFTCARSDYGILKKIINEININKKLKLNLFVCGSHLSQFYGNTINEIKMEISKGIILCPNIKFKNNEIDIASSYVALTKIIKEKISKKIDLMILLGDRYELLPITNLCLLSGIKIAHIHGGEITEGAIDNNIRNSISMMSNYHFVSNYEAKNQLLNFGIKKKNIFLLGSPSLENINKNLYPKNYLEKKFKFKFSIKNAIVTYHSETKNIANVKNNLKILLDSINYFSDIKFIFTAPGADEKSKFIKDNILTYVKKNKNTLFFDSLGHQEYLSFLKISDFVIGNSSSAIIEAPSLNTISINIGIRQKGRVKANSIIDLPFEKKKIIKVIENIYKRKTLDKKLFKNPYDLNKKPSIKLVKQLIKILKVK
jgi:GDP/UDP-N,N'-diacetylbacillosamine 2-epimerase (hydrolysing)